MAELWLILSPWLFMACGAVLTWLATNAEKIVTTRIYSDPRLADWRIQLRRSFGLGVEITWWTGSPELFAVIGPLAIYGQLIPRRWRKRSGDFEKGSADR